MLRVGVRGVRKDPGLWGGCLLASAAAFCGPYARAQEVTRSTTVQSSFSVQETLTDNVAQSSTNRKAESITTFGPGINISSRSGRVQGSLDYTLNAVVYARDSTQNKLQNNLGANVSAEAVENHAYVDARASISQQAISAFGPQPNGGYYLNNNSSEVASVSVSPRVRGNIAGVAELTAQVTWSGTRASGTGAGDSNNLASNVGASGSFGRFGWGLSASRQTNDFTAGRKTSTDSTTASLSFAPDPDLRLSVRGGRESSDVISGGRQSLTSSGWGVNWQPTERTVFDYQTDKRYFGQSHSFTFSHRMPRSVWSLSDTRSVSGDPFSQNRPLTLYDNYFLLFTSIEPDPVKRDVLVRNFLLSNGLDPRLVPSGGFLSSALSLQHTQTVSFSISGLRSDISLSAYRNDSRRLDTLSNGVDDLSSVDRVRQTGASLALSHRLTPDSSLTLVGTQSHTLDTPTRPGFSQRSISLTWSGTLSLRSSGTLGFRHTRSASDVNPFTESAVLGSLNYRF